MDAPTRAASPESIWKAAAEPAAFAPLAGDVETDVVIVGGGITGILCAWSLARKNIRCVVLEAGRVGEGSTGNSTGNLYAMVGQHAHALAKDDVAAQVWKSRAGAVDLIARIVADETLDCDFARRPWILYAHAADDAAFGQFERIERIAGLCGHGIRDGSADVPFPVARAIAIDGQAQFNPLRFVRQLAQRAAAKGVAIHEQSAVTELAPGTACSVTTAAGRVRAKWIVLATHTPKGVLKVHAALAPYREYGVALPRTGGRLPQGICWSTEDDRHSLRSYAFGGREYLVVVGEHHKTGQEKDTRECFAALERYGRKHFKVGAAAYRWSAQGYRSADSIPYIGESALGEKVLYASGFAADGLTYAAVAAPILADRIAGIPNADAEIYKAGRFTPVASAKSLVAENINVLEQYLKDVPGATDADEYAQVRRGYGKTLQRDGEKLAVYRGDAGELHVVSAVCTHMQCLVKWNHAERSWDCPCHGSRFDVDGAVIEGPALSPLPPTRKG